jgi:hypothetical protein
LIFKGAKIGIFMKSCHKTFKTGKIFCKVRRGNRLTAGKEPVGDFPSNNGFEGFAGFVRKITNASW